MEPATKWPNYREDDFYIKEIPKFRKSTSDQDLGGFCRPFHLAGRLMQSHREINGLVRRGAKRRRADATTGDNEMHDADLLYGLPAIAGQLGLSSDQVRHLAKSHGLPTFKLGRSVCARRSTLASWLTERESAAREPRERNGAADDAQA
jgi:excisionase family DNA binding protein